MGSPIWKSLSANWSVKYFSDMTLLIHGAFLAKIILTWIQTVCWQHISRLRPLRKDLQLSPLSDSGRLICEGTEKEDGICRCGRQSTSWDTCTVSAATELHLNIRFTEDGKLRIRLGLLQGWTRQLLTKQEEIQAVTKNGCFWVSLY